MSDPSKTSKPHGVHTPPVDGTSPLHLWTQLYKSEMKRFLDEATPAIDSSVDAWGRMLAESTMAAQAGMRAWHDATRTSLESTRKHLD